ncbi:MAG: hypothetical protein QF689_07555 [Candidatus Latescibacteria bacterium]|nr:hypothetical protein [Candidatus Latescibacterota bacterium]MDP7448421.1 hypothetical protein [Candidatus Latescibacterota bacterium]HJP31191.1 hypothetical protein [Candidatus Latescibacterota bacterium]
MSIKSDTCVGRTSGKPLTEYDSESEAEEGAVHARERFGKQLVPYRCDTCERWHLSPANRQTPSTKCGQCTGADGRPKDTYRNESEAQRRADILRREQGADLRVYACEHGSGWHLTRGVSAGRRRGRP